MRKEIFRIIDANYNRSREGLRVCEDIARFILNSPGLTKGLKGVRHGISNTVKSCGPAAAKALYRARDVATDVGRISRAKSEMKRAGTRDIFYANLERAKESLRVLEEFYKLTDKKASVRFTALRYRLYAIEKSSINAL